MSAHFNLDGRDSLAGLDNWIQREEPLDDRNDLLDLENDPLGIKQLYLDRDTAATEIGFWHRRRAELQRQLDEATLKWQDSMQRHDQADAQIIAMNEGI